MATEITMPKLSDTMTEGRLIAWKKGVGDRVERGDIIAEVETDKANMELEAFTAGVLLETRVKPGEMVPVGGVIAVIGGFDEKAPALPPDAKGAEPPAIPPTWQPPPPEPPHAPFEPGDVPERVAELPETGTPAKALPSSAVAGEKASPLVRRLAREKGIDLGQVTGSGPDGRILQEDLERVDRDSDQHNGPKELGTPNLEPRTPNPELQTGEAKRAAPQPLSRMRGAIARTVAESWRTIPHFYVTTAIDMGEAERVRQELKESGSPASVNDLVVKASALALGKFPRVNGSFAGDGIVLHDEVNIGVAVALEEGLLVPVVRGCQALSLKEIARRSRELAERARSGRISEAEITGGTFTVSNLGMHGVDEFAAVILPPQGAILAVGAVTDTPVIRSGHLAAARIMRVTLSADHRLLDGAYAAQFLAELKRILENPVTMLL